MCKSITKRYIVYRVFCELTRKKLERNSKVGVNLNLEKIYSVYIHTCPNNKKYIGTTKLKPKYRWGKNGNGYKHHLSFYEDIKKYGWDNIKHEIIVTGLSRDEAEQKEIELIAKFKSDNKDFGYNIQHGGFSTADNNNPFYGKKHSEESKKVMRQKWTYEKHFKNETIEKIRIATTGEKNPMYGKHHQEESNKKNMLSQKTRKSVKQYTIDGVFVAKFNSIREAARSVNGDKSHISKACKEERISYGYKWQFADEEVAV